MAVKIALVLTCISIGLLVVYGADVAVAQGQDQGFLPWDHMTRGMGLGAPAMILPIIGFFISRKEHSIPLGVLLIIAGVLIVIGGIVGLILAEPADLAESERSPIAMAAPLLIVGGFIIILGAIKFKKP